MKRTITCLAVINCISGLLLLALVTSGCSGSSGSESKSGEKTITSFSFTALNNPKALDADVAGVISGNTITVDIPHWTSLKSLTAKFETTGELVECSSYSQTSGVTVNDFTGGAVYKVTAEDGSSIEYTVNVTVGVPNPAYVLGTGAHNMPTNYAAYDLDLKDNYLFVADGTAGLTVVDVTDPANPVLCSNNLVLDDSDPLTYDCAVGIELSGNYAYLGVGAYGFAVADISDPENPVEIGHVYTASTAKKLALTGNNAYVADFSNGLVVMNILDPYVPSIIGGKDTTGYSEDVEVSGHYAYIADQSGGLRIMDISDPANPVLSASFATSSAFGLTIRDSYAYIADGNSGLKIIDISDHSSLVQAGYYDTSGTSQDVLVNGNYAFVADGGYGLAIIGISDPVHPEFVASLDTDGAYSLVIDGRYAYIADSSYGLVVIKL